jgi:CRISPR/Cas system CSM-associated protein Csm4 (group 5 of RAMP superfamily)
MSQLPDSQKIFGAICYAYADEGKNDGGIVDKYAQAAKCKKIDIVAEFVKAVKDKEVDIAISNVLPKGLFPVPKSYILRKYAGEENADNDKAGEDKAGNDKAVYQALKKRDFADETQIRGYIEAPGDIVNDNGGYAYLEPFMQAHASTEGPKSEPFSVLRTVCLKHNNNGDTVCHEFEFFLRCEPSEQNEDGDSRTDSTVHSDIILRLLKKGRILTLGPHSSQGYNLFEITENPSECNDFSYESETTVYLNLGMLLPGEINYSYKNKKNNIAPSLDLFTSERRPYAPQKWNPDAHAGWFISFIAPGSVVVASPDKPVATLSKCIYCKKIEEKDGEDAITEDESRLLFGNAVLMPIEGWCQG